MRTALIFALAACSGAREAPVEPVFVRGGVILPAGAAAGQALLPGPGLAGAGVVRLVLVAGRLPVQPLVRQALPAGAGGERAEGLARIGRGSAGDEQDQREVAHDQSKAMA